MDRSTACALKMVCKSNEVQDVMRTLSKEEVKRFIHGHVGPGRNSSLIFRDAPEVPVPPVNRCRMKRGRGRCRGTPSELALTQMCADHQTRQTGDLNVDGLRCFYASSPGLFQLMFAATLLTGQPVDVNLTCGKQNTPSSYLLQAYSYCCRCITMMRFYDACVCNYMCM